MISALQSLDLHIDLKCSVVLKLKDVYRRRTKYIDLSAVASLQVRNFRTCSDTMRRAGFNFQYPVYRYFLVFFFFFFENGHEHELLLEASSNGTLKITQCP